MNHHRQLAEHALCKNRDVGCPIILVPSLFATTKSSIPLSMCSPGSVSNNSQMPSNSKRTSWIFSRKKIANHHMSLASSHIFNFVQHFLNRAQKHHFGRITELLTETLPEGAVSWAAISVFSNLRIEENFTLFPLFERIETVLRIRYAHKGRANVSARKNRLVCCCCCCWNSAYNGIYVFIRILFICSRTNSFETPTKLRTILIVKNQTIIKW